MYEYSITITCEECNETHEIYDYHASDTESGNEEITCKCGAVIDVNYSVDVSIEHTPPEPEEEGNEKPGPNQLDLFTGKTVEEMAHKGGF